METFDTKAQNSIKEMINLGYKPKAFMSMIFEYGTINAVKKLLNNNKPSDGFIKLWEMGRLDLSMENIINSEEWGSLFTDEEKRIAKKRLIDYKFLQGDK